MKPFLSLGILSVLALLFGTGCNDTSARPKKDDRVIAVKQEDAEMNAAIAKAQTTLSSFIAVLSSPQTNQQYFLIKGKFTVGDTVEHIWVADVTFDGKRFRGVLANDPESIPSLFYKQPVEVQPAQVSDWMFVQDGKLVGGYTSRVLRNRMTEEERRQLDAKIPYRY
jgi:uncharacterized protein YegJ (DUF2314 family)